MFEHFTFGAQAQTRYFQQDEISASPTDTSFIPHQKQPQTEYPFPELPSNINDIVNQFTNYTLRPEDNEEARPSIWSETTLSSPRFEDTPFTTEELSYVSSRRGITTLNTSSILPTSHPSTCSRNDTGCRRLQRQLNTHLQSCRNHMKDINSLVEDMISGNEQCVLHTSSSSRQNTSTSPRSTLPKILETSISDLIVDEDSQQPQELDPNEDEGFAEMEDDEYAPAIIEEEMSLRRASTPSGIRKYGGGYSGFVAGIKFRSSADCVLLPNGYVPTEKHKIRCMPRMRKRRVCRRVSE